MAVSVASPARITYQLANATGNRALSDETFPQLEHGSLDRFPTADGLIPCNGLGRVLSRQSSRRLSARKAQGFRRRREGDT